jgi:hypothetical protein
VQAEWGEYQPQLRALHPEHVAAEVKKKKATSAWRSMAMRIAVIFVDEHGQIVDATAIMALCARACTRPKKLPRASSSPP